jgi:hypothetical protein
MSDPRFTDPRNSDPRLSDPVLRQDEPAGGIWGWVAGLAVLALIAFIVVAGWNSDHTASNNPNNNPPITTGSNAPRAPASTTGSGASSPSMPSAPTPSTPAQSPNGGR